MTSHKCGKLRGRKKRRCNNPAVWVKVFGGQPFPWRLPLCARHSIKGGAQGTKLLPGLVDLDEYDARVMEYRLAAPPANLSSRPTIAMWSTVQWPARPARQVR